MNKSDIINCLEAPEYVDKFATHEIKELLTIYPYLEAVHFIYLRKLFISDDIRFESQLTDSAMYISNRKVLYNYINFDIANVNTKNISLTELPSTIDYFSIENNPNHKKSLQELAQKLKEARLAKQNLKVTPSEIHSPEEKFPESKPTKSSLEIQTTEDYFNSISNDFSTTLEDISSLAHSINNIDNYLETTNDTNNKQEQITTQTLQYNTEKEEIQIKQLIKEKKYSNALEILKAINLNNSKKSIYFAVQIKFLETIIENNK